MNTQTEPETTTPPVFVGVKIDQEQITTLCELTNTPKQATALKIAASYFIKEHQTERGKA